MDLLLESKSIDDDPPPGSSSFLHSLLLLSAPFLLFYLTIRVCIHLIAWYIDCRYQIKLTIGRIRLLQVDDISLQLSNGFTLNLESVHLSSKYWNKHYESIIGIAVVGLRIQGDLKQLHLAARKHGSDFEESNACTVRPETRTAGAGTDNTLTNDSECDPLEVRFHRITTVWLRKLETYPLLSWFSIRIQNFSFNQLGISSEGFKADCLLNTTVQDSCLHFRSVQKGLRVRATANGIGLRLFKSGLDETCLADLSLSAHATLWLNKNGQLEASSRIEQLQVIVFDGLPAFTSQIKRNKKHSEPIHLRSNTQPSRPDASLAVRRWLRLLLNANLKQIQLQVSNASVKCMKDHGQKVLSTSFEQFELTLTKSQNQTFEVRLAANDFDCASRQSPFVELTQTLLVLQATQESSFLPCFNISALLELSDCDFFYNQLECEYWLKYIQSFTPAKSSHRRASLGPQCNLLESLLTQSSPYIKVTTAADISRLKFTLKSPNNSSTNFYTTLNHFKFSQLLNPDPLLKELNCECLLESMCCYRSKPLKPLAPTLEELDNIDFNQVPLYLNTLIFKANYAAFTDVRINCVANLLLINLNHMHSFLDRFTLDRSPTTSTSALPTRPDSSSSASPLQSPDSSNKKQFRIQISAHSLVTFVAQHRLNVCSVLFEKTSNSKTSLALNQIDVASLKPLLINGPTDHKIFEISKFKYAFDEDQNRRSITLSDRIYFQWNLSSHLKLFKMLHDFRTMSSRIWSPAVQTKPTSTKRLSQSVLEIKVDGSIEVGALLCNDGSNMLCTTHQLRLEYHHANKFHFHTPHLLWQFDSNKIFEFRQLNIQKWTDYESTSYVDRKQAKPSLTDEQNRCLCVEIGQVEVHFPYKYNFALAFNERFITLFKWLKLYHKGLVDHVTLQQRSARKSSTDSFHASFDLKIKIGQAALKLHDDPFEKKLHENYMLMEDEYREGLKRRDCLTKKISEVQKNKALSKDKIQELYNALDLKQEQIYIERQGMLKQRPDAEQPASFFTVEIQDLELVALADSSLTGETRLRRLIRDELDKPSQLPDDVHFNTLWGRHIVCNVQSLSCTLRDFKRPMVAVSRLNVTGLLIGAEQEANSRARRTCTILRAPDETPVQVIRSMTALKYYHDLDMDAEHFVYTHGSCWDSVLQQLNLSFEYINKPSVDPSPSLPWYDRMRFLFHGLVKVKSQKLAVVLHGSLNPYNDTEFIEIACTRCMLIWQIGKISVHGDLAVYVHTESKYDELRIVHIPNVRLAIDLNWICLGNQFDHHSVMPCAADKLPEYSSNQVHDSYRAFRSQNLNLAISLESDQSMSSGVHTSGDHVPSILLYSSTLRWLERLKFVFSGFPRLTRRGPLFKNVRPRKIPFSRSFKRIRLTVCLNKLKVSYFSSFSKQFGVEIIGGYLSHSGEHSLSFLPFKDGLKRRPRPTWDIVYMNSEVCNVEVWLHENQSKASAGTRLSSDKETDEFPEFTFDESELTNGDSHYLMSFTRMCYHREAVHHSSLDSSSSNTSDTPTHSLVIHDLKGAWTKANRDIALTLFDLYIKAEQLRRNLSTDALKAFHPENAPGNMNSSPTKVRYGTGQTASPASTLNRGHAACMLQKLIEDSEAYPDVVYTEDVEPSLSGNSSTSTGTNTGARAGPEAKLRGIAACSDDDVLHQNWLVELVNSQVMLRGIETQGYLIVSAANTRILQRLHKPVWKERRLYAKSSWVGSVECMQYYATLDPVRSGDIVWLSVDNIQSKPNAANCGTGGTGTTGSGSSATLCREMMGGSIGSTTAVEALVDLVGEAQCAGGLVTAALLSPNAGRPGAPEVGSSFDAIGAAPTSVELQRIISQCGCQFFYASFTEQLAGGGGPTLQDLPPLPDEPLLEPWDGELAVDSFTFTHPQLSICTNSQQFRMIIDIINNLLCYVRPQRRQAHEKLQRLRFRLLLSPLEEQRVPIMRNQQLLREHVRTLISLERNRYALHREYFETRAAQQSPSLMLRQRLRACEARVQQCRQTIDQLNEELYMLISSFNEAQLTEDRIKQREAAAQEHGHGASLLSSVLDRIEICFRQASWRLTDRTGQLGLADLQLSDFLYTKVAKNDDSVEHTLELGNIRVQNLLPNQAYRVVLQPSRMKGNVPLDQHRALRVFCRESPPVGGISIKEHFEVNVIPLTIELTSAFVKEMLRFFFPEKYEVPIETTEAGSMVVAATPAGRNRRKANSTAGVASYGSANELSETDLHRSASQKRKEDIEEKMRQRALRNQNFVYIKIPEVPIRVSYKGNKEKNIEDIKDFTLILPTIEYHNQNWTWLDVLMAIKAESKRRLLTQAVKQKLQIRPNFFGSSNKQSVPEEEEELSEQQQKANQMEEEEHKARLLLGKIAVPFSTSLEKSSKFKGSGLSLFSQKK